MTTDDARRDLYRLAVEERQFEVEFNWRREQYLLALNVAVLAGGVATAQQAQGRVPVLLFAVGAVGVVLTALIARTQHGYYRQVRDRVKAIEDAEGLVAPYRSDTTPGMDKGREDRSRLISVTNALYLLLAAIGVADVAGAVWVLVRG